MGQVTKVGVLTSGGDAPGMNAAVRAVVRAAIFNKLKVVGIKQGYHGMIQDRMEPMTSKSVSNIIHQGGTILKSARSEGFRTPEGRKKAFENLKKSGVDGLVVIGGDGTFTGARIFSQEYNIPIVGIPGTIDNDLFGTDYTIGYDTALNTVVQAVDKIRDTASAHSRLFFIEVMGRDAGFLALRSGIASGAEAILVPEIDTDFKQLYTFLEKGFNKDKSSSIVLVAEGEKISGGAIHVAERVQKEYPDYDTRVTILGHIQRGGSPTAFDRVTASRMGVSAIEALVDDQKSIMIGLVNKEITHIPFNQALKNKKKLNPSLVELTSILSI
ncbi:6-phosphofructokinase [Saccharicrinis fermentans]|uniref:ATP-dependent 6-phosphofructokinase n=1 Tax=Saccharicrinis fermentans DSM 9555 = JCM 21142 TaxID=869213 RepID=W7YSM4_9BACT|nr:6-phosphofructokinase [Saccharicrinis fermentans]GAF05459.1 6-phosphofructokinase isozyme 1 [Saccharicrinis fermentans DSM 9555 = JCM 21142]